jgi:hypothetical protein
MQKALQASAFNLVGWIRPAATMTLDSNSLVARNVWCAVPALDLLGSFHRIAGHRSDAPLGICYCLQGCAAAGLLRLWRYWAHGQASQLHPGLQALIWAQRSSAPVLPCLLEGC